MTGLTDHKSKVEFGRRLREAREKRNLSQVDVAEKAEIHFNYYARIERGDANPSFDLVLKIAKILGIKL